MDPLQPESKVPRIDKALPVGPATDAKIETEEDLLLPKSPVESSQPSGRDRSDAGSTSSRSSARTRRARAALEAERAAAEYAAAKMRVAKAELEVIDAEESEEERERIETEQDVGTPRLSTPPDAAPAVVLPMPLNQPTVYHHIGDPVEFEAPRMEEESSSFYDPDDVKAEEQINERGRIDAEYEQLNRAQQSWARQCLDQAEWLRVKRRSRRPSSTVRPRCFSRG